MSSCYTLPFVARVGKCRDDARLFLFKPSPEGIGRLVVHLLAEKQRKRHEVGSFLERKGLKGQRPVHWHSGTFFALFQSVGAFGLVAVSEHQALCPCFVCYLCRLA